MTETEKIISEIRSLPTLKNWGKENLVNGAKQLATLLRKRDEATKTQLRKFLHALRKLEANFEKADFKKDDVILLRPKFAYTVARKEELVPLGLVLEEAIGKVSEREDFESLLRFVESVVAYNEYLPLEKRLQEGRR